MIFLDYNGIIDQSGKPHVGARVIFNREDIAVILHPGAQGIDQAAWDEVKAHPTIGWKDGEYEGVLFTDGALRVLPSVDDKEIDWSKIPRGDLVATDGLIKRTVHPKILDSLRAYAVSRSGGDEAWAKVVTKVEAHLEDICTGFDGKQVDVDTAQSRFKQVIGM